MFCCRYTYGQPVNGQANIYVQLEKRYAGDRTTYPRKQYTATVSMLISLGQWAVALVTVVVVHCVSEKKSHWTRSSNCEILTDLENSFTAEKWEISNKTYVVPILPTTLRYVAALPWKVKSSDLLKTVYDTSINCIMFEKWNVFYYVAELIELR